LRISRFRLTLGPNAAVARTSIFVGPIPTNDRCVAALAR
jgi:hypothetical protein